ncbi:MAG TPA: maleylpyruvate isomerase N-terminal domain-containing protein [Actinomycetes bacterium]|nr:maleylpyruvate isomerase N-terminal domain-containing protein [Actinomycetes bacterium]
MTTQLDGTAWASALDEAIVAATEAMAAADAVDWSRPAGDLGWDCRATVLHIASDFIGYATQLTAPRAHGYAALDLVLEGTPNPAELRALVRATGGLLSSVARTADAGTRSWHPYGVAGPCDFAAMGIVELLVHTEDLSRGLGFAWAPAPDLSARVLAHLFPYAPRGHEPWPTLLWATGRAALGERPRLPDWRWENTGG